MVHEWAWEQKGYEPIYKDEVKKIFFSPYKYHMQSYVLLCL